MRRVRKRRPPFRSASVPGQSHVGWIGPMIAWDLEQNTPYLGKWGSKSLSRWSSTLAISFVCNTYTHFQGIADPR
jgi:hypothetical protein